MLMLMLMLMPMPMLYGCIADDAMQCKQEIAARAFAEYTSMRRRILQVENGSQRREVAGKVDDNRDAMLQSMFDRLLAEMDELRQLNREKDAEIAAMRQQQNENAAKIAALEQHRQQQLENADADADADTDADAPSEPKPREDVCKDIICYDDDYINDLADSIGSEVVNAFEQEYKFNEKCNFDIRQIIESVLTISVFCHVIMQSPTQTDKSYGIAALAICAMKFGYPFMCFVLTDRGNIADMCAEKMGKVLDKFGIKTFFLNNTRLIKRMSDDDVALFKIGKLAIFAQGRHNNFAAVRAFFREREVYNSNVVLDESDAFFSSVPGLEKTHKEKELRKLTESPHANEPLNAHVRCIHYVSATSKPTRDVVKSYEKPFRTIIADNNTLKQRGYALPDSIKVLRDRDGRPQYLDINKQNKKHSYNLYAREIEVMMDQFVDDLNDPNVYRRGGLLMVSLTPYINEKDGVIVNADVVKYLMKMYRDKAKAKILTMVPDLRGDAVAIVGLVKRGGSLIIGQASGIVDRYLLTWDGAQPICDTISSSVGKVIKSVDEQYTLDTPVITGGYYSLARSCSARSDLRVITHAICSSTIGAPWGDNNQRNTRYGGSTVKFRNDNGFDYVTMLMQKEDADRHPLMYDVTAKCLVNDDDEIDEETAESIVQMAKIRPLASGKLGKFMEHNATLRLEQARGNGNGERPTLSFMELEEIRTKKAEEKKQRKDAFNKSAADDRDEAIAREDDGEIIDPGPNVEVSVPMAVRISKLLHATTPDVQVPAVYETETSEKMITRATAAAFEHFQTKFGVTFPKVVVTKAKDGEDAKYAYKFTSKYDPTGRSLCGRVIPDAYRIRSKRDMKCTAYVLYKMDGNPDVAGSSSSVARTIEWKFVEDKETKRIMACYTVARTIATTVTGRVRKTVPLATIVKDQPGVGNDVIRDAMEKLGSSTNRVELLLRFIMFNPGFVGTKGHFAQAIKVFNPVEFAKIPPAKTGKKFDIFHSNVFEDLVENGIMTHNDTLPITYTAVASEQWWGAQSI